MALSRNGEILDPGVELVVDDVAVSYLSLLNSAETRALFGVTVIEPDPPTLDDLKAARLDALADARRAASANFTVNGLSFNLDADTETAIAKAIQSLERQPEGTAIQWEVRRGVIVSFDLQTLGAIGDAAFLHVQACFANVAAKTALINAATDAAGVAGVSLADGWP